jgi:glycosyltransferase involved in cell wall biosynthesis
MQLPPFAGKTVVTVGRLVAWKGIDRLMRTVASLPAVRLIIVGDGPEMASLKRLAGDLELGERVIFTGQVSPKEVRQHLCASDFFVLNSTYEGLPHIVLEAMEAGIPVIATDVGGTGEIVQHEVNGLLIPPRDDEALRSSIVRLLHNSDECIRFVNAGYDTIAEHFQWETLVKTTEGLLSAIAFPNELHRFS